MAGDIVTDQTIPADDSDVDLYCLNCGYNLRGLSGDPRRCPECFYLNPVGDLHLPAEVITKQLRDMETAPSFCLGSVLVLGPCLASMISIIFVQGHDPAALSCAGIILVVLVGVWAVGAIRFRSSCQRNPGWFTALMKFHAYGLIMGVLMVGSVLFCLWVLSESSSPTSSWLSLAAQVLACIMLFVFTWFAVIWGYRKAKEDVEPLQRDVAVTIARNHLRKRMAHQKGRKF